MNKYTVTWATFNVSQISLFQDPTYESYIPTDEFIQIYKPLLESLDGSDMCAYIDLFFRRSPVNSTIFEFVDEDSRLDFRDMAEEMGLIAPIKEIAEGESKKDKQARMKKPVAPQKPKPAPRLEHVSKEIDRLVKLLEHETNSQVREKLTLKLQKALAMSQKSC